MHITEVIKQEVIPPDIVKYQGVIIRPLTPSQPQHMGMMQRLRDQLQKVQHANVNAICLF